MKALKTITLYGAMLLLLASQFAYAVDKEYIVWVVKYNPQRVECINLLPTAKQERQLLKVGHTRGKSCDGSNAVAWLDLDMLLSRHGDIPVVDCEGNPVLF